MREILFRGKRIDNGEWVHGSYLLSKIGKNAVPAIAPYGPLVDMLDNGKLYQVDPNTTGQYTGLTDKNGVKIFEGDIIKIPDNYDEFGVNAGEAYEVYFFYGGFRLKPKYSKARGYWLEDDKTVIVIGNIHDNPELLNDT